MPSLRRKLSREVITRKATLMATPLLARVAPKKWKGFNELNYWKSQQREEGDLANDHYERFYTTHFGLTHEDYAGKVVLDIGCGPRGSLEWAAKAKRRIGLDPLADDYLALGAASHEMEYISAPSEQMPLDDHSCDIVCSFNSLDHVDDVHTAVSEIERVTAIGGRFLLLIEINHPPTACEPHLIPPTLVDDLAPVFRCIDMRAYREPAVGGVYKAIEAGELHEDPYQTAEPTFLSAHLIREPQDTR